MAYRAVPVGDDEQDQQPARYKAVPATSEGLSEGQSTMRGVSMREERESKAREAERRARVAEITGRPMPESGLLTNVLSALPGGKAAQAPQSPSGTPQTEPVQSPSLTAKRRLDLQKRAELPTRLPSIPGVGSDYVIPPVSTKGPVYTQGTRQMVERDRIRDTPAPSDITFRRDQAIETVRQTDEGSGGVLSRLQPDSFTGNDPVIQRAFTKAVQDAGGLDKWGKLPVQERRARFDLATAEQGSLPQVPWDRGASSAWQEADLKAGTIPFIGAVPGGVDIGSVYLASKRIDEGKGSKQDEQEVMDFIIESQIRGMRENTVAGGAVDITTQMPAFMLEFIATQPVYAGGKKIGRDVVENTIGKVTRRLIERAAAEKGTKRAGALIAGERVAEGVGGAATGAALQSLSMGHRIPEQYFHRRLQGDSAADAAWKAPLDNFIEVFTEHAGGAIPAGKMAKVRGAIGKWLGMTPNATADDFVRAAMRRAAYHGPLGEIGEEELGKVMRTALLGDPYQLTTPKELGSQALAFSIPEAAGSALGMIGGKPVEAPQQVREAIEQPQEVSPPVETPQESEAERSQISEQPETPAAQAQAETPDAQARAIAETEALVNEPVPDEQPTEGEQIERARQDMEAARAEQKEPAPDFRARFAQSRAETMAARKDEQQTQEPTSASEDAQAETPDVRDSARVEAQPEEKPAEQEGGQGVLPEQAEEVAPEVRPAKPRSKGEAIPAQPVKSDTLPPESAAKSPEATAKQPPAQVTKSDDLTPESKAKSQDKSAKQPWGMSREEAYKSGPPKGEKPPIGNNWSKSVLGMWHEAQVKQAIARGDIASHPDYPDLTKPSATRKETKGIGEQAQAGGQERTQKSTSASGSIPPAALPESHVVIYNGKVIPVDGDKKSQFKRGAQRIADNGAEGYVVTPKGEVFKVTQSSRKAKRVTGEEADKAIREASASAAGQEDLSQLNKNDLILRMKDAGLKPKSSMTKAQMVEALSAKQPEEETRQKYTTIPPAWHGKTLYAWKSDASVSIPKKQGKIKGRRSLPLEYHQQLKKVPNTAKRLIEKIKSITGEWINVEGKYPHFLAPEFAVKQAKSEVTDWRDDVAEAERAKQKRLQDDAERSKRGEIVYRRLTPAERDQLKNEADRNEMTVKEYLKQHNDKAIAEYEAEQNKKDAEAKEASELVAEAKDMSDADWEKVSREDPDKAEQLAIALDNSDDSQIPDWNVDELEVELTGQDTNNEPDQTTTVPSDESRDTQSQGATLSSEQVAPVAEEGQARTSGQQLGLTGIGPEGAMDGGITGSASGALFGPSETTSKADEADADFRSKQTKKDSETSEMFADKEPWELTPKEYASSSKSVDERAVSLSAHPQHVKRALADGKPVPDRVLDAYKNNGWAAKELDRRSNKSLSDRLNAKADELAEKRKQNTLQGKDPRARGGQIIGRDIAYLAGEVALRATAKGITTGKALADFTREYIGKIGVGYSEHTGRVLSKARKLIESGYDAKTGEWDMDTFDREHAQMVAQYEKPEPKPEPEKAEPQEKTSAVNEDYKATPYPTEPDEKPKPEGSFDPKTFSARQAQVNHDREAWGKDGLQSNDRRSWGMATNTARERGIPGRAMQIAASIIEKPRPLDDVETAGLVDHGMTLKKEHDRLLKEIGKTDDPATLSDLVAQVNRVEDDFDILTKALFTSGSEKGRALASQKLTINQNFDLVSVLNRAKSAKGGGLTSKERAQFEKMADEHKEYEARIVELEAQIDEMIAERAVRSQTSKRLRSMSREERASDRRVRANRIAELLKAGCN